MNYTTVFISGDERFSLVETLGGADKLLNFAKFKYLQPLDIESFTFKHNSKLTNGWFGWNMMYNGFECSTYDGGMPQNDPRFSIGLGQLIALTTSANTNRLRTLCEDMLYNKTYFGALAHEVRQSFPDLKASIPRLVDKRLTFTCEQGIGVNTVLGLIEPKCVTVKQELITVTASYRCIAKGMKAFKRMKVENTDIIQGVNRFNEFVNATTVDNEWSKLDADRID